VEVATQHPERQGVASGEAVEKRLLLGGVALQRGDVPGGHAELTVAVETHLADAAASGPDEAPVPTSHAADRAVGLGGDE
jgi:hypothetical protein